jgi:hypothetical protein
MSLGIVVKAPEGLVLAAESRVTLSANPKQGLELHVNFDNATKLLSFSTPHEHVGVVTYGLAAIGMRTAHSYVSEFEASLPKERIEVKDFAIELSEFFQKRWGENMPSEFNGPNMTFVVGGFNENEPYGKTYLIELPRNPVPLEKNPDAFGITWGGQREYVDRLIGGFDARLLQVLRKELDLKDNQLTAIEQSLASLQMQIPLTAMPLQDCVNLAIFFVRTTIQAQALSVGVRGCGGPIDLAIITRREGIRFIQKKEIVGESGQISTFA